jgi:hypothetical protein
MKTRCFEERTNDAARLIWIPTAVFRDDGSPRDGQCEEVEIAFIAAWMEKSRKKKGSGMRTGTCIMMPE